MMVLNQQMQNDDDAVHIWPNVAYDTYLGYT